MTSKKITLEIGQQSISLNCTSEEEGRIKEIAAALNNKINKLREQTQIADRERLTIMAALTLIGEIKHSNKLSTDNVLAQIPLLNEKIEATLKITEK